MKIIDFYDLERKKFKAFKARYFPIFLCAFFSSSFSASCTISLMASTYFKDYPKRATYTIIVAILVSTILTMFNYLVLLGRPGAMWGVVALNVLCLCLILSLTGNTPHFIVYITGIILPLLSLLALNSQRHREMRRVLVTVRQLREEIQQRYKKRRRRR
ncbi:hypothetical protein [Pseudomonas agarici]|uniref:hypothetical protein n=1 Tax=Pseudomonas agarici TaxID=46677 RepID=UPI000944B63C|nr:hypothetical protein [Pseudomonas agarici]NWC11214.1 hypothetical protein [Pseudomonas agarici]